MRRSRVQAKIRAGEAVRICGLGHFIPPFIRHAAHHGYDAIWLDLEHRAMDSREIQALLAFFHLFDIDCMLRPPHVSKTQLYRYLEDGATGLMIPHVSTREMAEDLVQSVKFPPLGNRGLDGAGLDSDFIFAGGPDFAEKANRETFLVVQIETLEAVRNVDEIAAVDGIDGLFVGPGDLGLRLRQDDPPQMTLEEARKQVAEAAARHGKQWGQPAGTKEMLQTLYDEGARLLSHGSDFGGMMKILDESCGNFDSVCGPRSGD
ncbi:MAG: 4-hydroxy-2-oxovalerate aldolase [Planctomycetaceae bacterium]|nr:4-hydroxy-2-oxovalerate aldolase [Planctomycetaceae bacterium]